MTEITSFRSYCENELYPRMLSIGVPFEMLGKLNPKKIEMYIKANKLQQQSKDWEQWTLGMYFMQGAFVAVDHALNGRKARSEYPEKPFHELQEEQEFYDATDLSEEEKVKLREQLFGYLGGLKDNFEQVHGK